MFELQTVLYNITWGKNRIQYYGSFKRQLQDDVYFGFLD